jgi:hypothetical protein
MGPSRFTSHPKEDVLRVFIALKNSIASAGFESATLGSSGKHTSHYTTEMTVRKVLEAYELLGNN